MNGLDYAILCVVVISAVVGLWRGFMRETVSLLTWITAFGVALTFGDNLAAGLSGVIDSPTIRMAAAFIFLFAVVMIVGVIANYFLANLLKKAGLRTSDRVLGGVFGTARGVVILALVVVLAELTPMVDSTVWQGSLIVGYIQPMVAQVQKFFPAVLDVSFAQGFGTLSR